MAFKAYKRQGGKKEERQSSILKRKRREGGGACNSLAWGIFTHDIVKTSGRGKGKKAIAQRGKKGKKKEQGSAAHSWICRNS